MSPAASPRRRTQEERRQESRTRLLDATVDALVEGGYAAATVGEVARRAGLSVGCLQNYFPSKAELVAAAVEHLYERQRTEIVALLGNLPPADDAIAAGIRVLWSVYQRDNLRPFLEVLLAAQNEPKVQEAVTRAQTRMSEAAVRTFWEFFEPIPGTRHDPVGIVAVVLGTCEALSISHMAAPHRLDHVPGLAVLESLLRTMVRPKPAPSDGRSRLRALQGGASERSRHGGSSSES